MSIQIINLTKISLWLYSTKTKTTTSPGRNIFSVSLEARTKQGSLSGSVVLPEPSSPLYQPWKVCNARVKLWMMSSMSKSLQDYVRYAETAHKAWEDLRMIFVPSVDLRIRQLR
ncbi:unnamed protein product [Brassica oleracea var. botrytis]